MPSPAPFAQQQQYQPQSSFPPLNVLFPVFYLYPLNETRVSKYIALTNLHTKIGPQTSSKTTPGEQNEFFGTKMPSRQHVEVWEEGGKQLPPPSQPSNNQPAAAARGLGVGSPTVPVAVPAFTVVATTACSNTVISTQPAIANSFSFTQPTSPTASDDSAPVLLAAIIQDLQLQLRDTQSRLAGHLGYEREGECERRGDEHGEGDDARSIATVMAYELERRGQK